MKYYKQCSFKSDNLRTVAWIEEKGAKVGYSMKFKDSSDPERRWTVTGVGEERRTEEQAKAHERAYLKHRKATDI